MIFLPAPINIAKSNNLSAISHRDHCSINILSNFNKYTFFLSIGNSKLCSYLYAWVGNFVSKQVLAYAKNLATTLNLKPVSIYTSELIFALALS